ncbi:MAG: hypothetical protein ACFFAY_00900 [Promethearchaeota archaeon]
MDGILPLFFMVPKSFLNQGLNDDGVCQSDADINVVNLTCIDRWSYDALHGALLVI